MITNRRKSRLDEEAPVLFRLPNLRSRDINPSASGLQSTASSDAVGNSFRIDAASSSQTSSFQTSARPEPHDESATPSNGDYQTVTSSQPTNQVPSPTSQGRSWMERIGSRLILLVTLMAIVSVAWLTGQRMPASKPDIWQATDVISPAGANGTAVNSLGEQGVAKVVTGQTLPSLPTATPSAPSASTPSAIVSNASPSPAAAKVEPLTSVPPVGLVQDRVAVLDAPANGSSSNQPLPTSVYKPNVETETVLPTKDIVSIFDTVTLEPTDFDDASSNGVQPLEQISSAASGGVQQDPPRESKNAYTATPNAPVFEPSELLSWLGEQTDSRENRVTITPNPIVDWSQYLPGAGPSVRAASATQIPGNGVSTQQAAFPNGVTVNPYGQ